MLTFQVYLWLVIVPNIGIFLGMLTALSILAIIILITFYLINSYFVTDLGARRLNEEEKEALRSTQKWLKIFIILFFTSVTASIFFPSSEQAKIVGLSYIIDHSPQLKKLPTNLIEVTNKYLEHQLKEESK